MKGFEVDRAPPHKELRLSEVFRGLEKSKVVRSLFGGEEKAAEILRDTLVRLDESAEYMYVDDKDGSIIVSGNYLYSAEENLLYLDIIHELVHVKQFKQGRELFDPEFSYVDRPTELEAYKITLDEARRLGMTEEEIEDYLYVEWISKKEHKKLAETLGVRGGRRRILRRN